MKSNKEELLEIVDIICELEKRKEDIHRKIRNGKRIPQESFRRVQ